MEKAANVVSGFIMSMLFFQFVVAPIMGFNVSLLDNFIITFIFTVFSVAREYLWNIFVRWFHNKISVMHTNKILYKGEWNE